MRVDRTRPGRRFTYRAAIFGCRSPIVIPVPIIADVRVADPLPEIAFTWSDDDAAGSWADVQEEAWARVKAAQIR